MRGLDLSRPDILYAIIWGAVVLLAVFIPLAYIEPINDTILWIVFSNIFSFLLIYKIIYLATNARQKQANPFMDERETYIFGKFIKKLISIWFVGYLINVAASGGLPFFWLLMGDSRTYVDYGLPTFSGLINMLRSFIFAGCIIVFLKTHQKIFMFVAFMLLFSTVLEVSRGGISVLLLHGVAVWVMQKKFKFFKLVFAVILFIIFIIFFGIFAELRGHGVDVASLVGDHDVFLELPSGFFWVYTYLVSPFNNLNYAANMGFEPLYAPYFSIQALVPSIIRNFFFPPFDYPLALVSEAFNATSYYGPILADFGYVGAIIVVFMFQFFTAYAHIKAKSGNTFYYLAYPAFFMSVIMSVFYAYIFSMIVIMYPIIAFFYMRYRKKLIKRT